MFIFFEKPKSLIKYSLILLPAILILLFIYIYGGFLIENVSFLPDKKETSSHLELVQNVSLKHQQDFSFIKMLVIRDQAEFKKLSTQTNCGFPSTSESDEFNQSLTKSSRRSVRIVRGNEAEPNSFPWMASLKHVRNSIVYEHFCAGSLIYDKYVLTAAHCLTGLSKENFVVVLEQAISNTYKIFKFKIHEKYKHKDPNYDIALIELKNRVPTSKNVRSICVPDADVLSQSIFDEYAVVAGWGRPNPYSLPEKQRILHKTVLKVINGNTLCSKHLKSFDYSNLYCAHDTNLEKNSNVCIGDSGGPLMIYKHGKYYTYGIISFVFTFMDTDGNWKCYTQAPSYFIKVVHFLDWIAECLTSL